VLDLKQLKAIDAIARHGSMAAAARALDWSQPTLAHHIRTLESYLKRPVLYRRARGSELTPAGQALQPFARKIIELAVMAEQTARSAERVHARLTVGVFSTAGAFLLPPAVPALNDQGISVDIIQEDDAVALQRNLVNGPCDAAILYGLPDHPSDGNAVELLREALYVLLPEQHRLAGVAAVALEDLASEGWIMSKSPGDPCDELLSRAGQHSGFSPRCVLRTDDYTVLQGYVSAGLGVSLVPAMALLFAGPHVVAVPVSGARLERVIRLEVAPHALADPSVLALVGALRISGKKLSHQLENVHLRRLSTAKPSAGEDLNKNAAPLGPDAEHRP
jgi:molybdate transport repressor ModE-like protein